MKLKFLAALALSAVLLLSGCAAPAQNETTPESASAASETIAVSERVITDSCGTKTELPDDPRRLPLRLVCRVLAALRR